MAGTLIGTASQISLEPSPLKSNLTALPVKAGEWGVETSR